MTLIAPAVFIAVNVLVGGIAIRTIAMIVLGRMPLEWWRAGSAVKKLG